MNWDNYIEGLVASIVLAGLVWIISIIKRDVSIVDAIWSSLFIVAAVFYVEEIHTKAILVFSLLLIWGIRLCLHITIRSWGHPEDHRYEQIRQKYSPGFAIKSLFIIFIFQAVLAWIISLPVFLSVNQNSEWTFITYLASAVVLFGIAYESLTDWQLAKFSRLKNNKGAVLDEGLWAYCRHPNYFGEALIWWGFYLFALELGYWWSIVSPLLITYFLLKFSGVSLLESTISERRPSYRAYIKSTNAFIPGPKKKEKAISVEETRS